MPLSCADELNNQEKGFQMWLLDVTTTLSKQYLKEIDIKEIGSPSDCVNSAESRFIISQDKENVAEGLLRILMKNCI